MVAAPNEYAKIEASITASLYFWGYIYSNFKPLTIKIFLYDFAKV